MLADLPDTPPAAVSLTDILRRTMALAADLPDGSASQRAALHAAESMCRCLRRVPGPQDDPGFQALADDLGSILPDIPKVSTAALALSALRRAAAEFHQPAEAATAGEYAEQGVIP